MRKISNQLQVMSEQELELYRKQSEIELMRLPLVQFEYEIKRDWMPVLALCAIVVFGVAAFALQFISDGDQEIQRWGRNFLMVIIGGLTAMIPRGIKTDSSGRTKDSSSNKGG